MKNIWELLECRFATTPIMMDNPSDMHRASYVFERGNWLVKGNEVQPGCSACIESTSPGSARTIGLDWRCG